VIFRLSTISLLFFAGMIFSSCENDMATIRQITSQQDALTENGTDIEVLYSDAGHVKAKLDAPLMNRHHTKDPFTEMPGGLQLYFYDDSLQVNSQLKAGYGVTYDKSDEMIARNNVEVVNAQGDKLNTEELVWNQKTQKISSEKFVKITTKDEIIFGDGFESNQDLSNYTIKKISGTVHLKEQL